MAYFSDFYTFFIRTIISNVRRVDRPCPLYLWRRFCGFIVNFEHISHLRSSVSIVNFEHVIAGWDMSLP